MKLFVEKKRSKKTDNDYIALFIDLDYRVAILTLDRLIISEITGMSILELNMLKYNERVEYKNLERA